MIYGIGTDIVEIKRVRDAIEKWGERFFKRIFTEKEISYCYKKKDPYPHFAVRFAAKEAVIKALSPEDRSQKSEIRINFKDVEILNYPTGKPFINIHNSKLLTLNSFIIHLSLSHEHNYALATVVLERKNS